MSMKTVAGVLIAVLLAAAAQPLPAAVSRAMRRELDRSEALLRQRLGSLPPGSGVVLERDADRLTLRVPAQWLFDPDSADLRQEHTAVLPLQAAALVLKKQRRLAAEIDVYSDTLGIAATNLALTQQRALTVEGMLDTAGVAPSRVTALGKGGVMPLAANDTAEGRVANRRVEIVLARAEQLLPAPPKATDSSSVTRQPATSP